MNKPRWVSSSSYATQIQTIYEQDRRYDINNWQQNMAENVYGQVIVWDDVNQKDLPVICGHGGSMWLCRPCGEAIVK